MNQDYKFYELYDEEIGGFYRGINTKKIIEIKEINNDNEKSKVLFSDDEMLVITGDIVKDSYEFEYAEKTFTEILVTDLDNLKIEVSHKLLDKKFNIENIDGELNYILRTLSSKLDNVELQFILSNANWRIINKLK